MNYSIDQLEKSVIGAVLLRTDTLALLPSIESAHFVTPIARATWNAIRNCEARGLPIDITTIGDDAERHLRIALDGSSKGDIEQACSMLVAFLGECACTVPTVENAVEYARRLKDHALKRRLRATLVDVLEASTSGETTGAEVLTMALAGLSVLDAEQPEIATPIGELVQRRIRDIERLHTERQNGGQQMTGFPTGVDRLDEKIAGWQPGIVSIVAARPAMGKSSLGLATADACSSAGFGVHLFSLEDTDAAYADRALARTSRVEAERIRNCNLNREQFAGIQEALRKLSRRQGWLFDGRSGITADEIVRSVRRRRKANKTKVVIVDYVQLVKRPPRMSAHEALGEIITTFADAAKQDGIAYVVMSQLNRELEKRDDKRPLLSDLRESGSLEERSKCVVGLYRGSVYGQPQRHVDYDCECGKIKEHYCKPPSDAEFDAQVQLLILKNSNGRTGKVTAAWHGPTTRVE